MYHTDIMGSALDNWITGHYGEDQYDDSECMNEVCVNFEDCPCGYDTELCFERETDDFEKDVWESAYGINDWDI